MNNLRKLAEQQKNQHPPKIKNRLLKQTHGKRLAETLDPLPEKMENIIESTIKLGEIVKKSDVDNDYSQTLAKEKTQNDIQPGVIKDTASEINLSKKTQKDFLK